MTITEQTRKNLYRAAIEKDDDRIARLERMKAALQAQGLTIGVATIAADIEALKAQRDRRIDRMNGGQDA